MPDEKDDERDARLQARIEAEREAREERERASGWRASREGAAPPAVPPRRTPTLTEFPPAPIDRRPDGGRFDSTPARVEATHKAIVPVWGMIVILLSAVGGGAGVANYFSDKIAKLREELNEIKTAQAVNQAVVQLTLTEQGKDIKEIKDALHIAQQVPLTPAPTPEKKPSPEKPHR